MSLTPAQEMLNVKLNCDGFMTDSESEEEEGVSKLSKKSGALLDIQKKPGVVLAVEEQNEIDNEGATKEKGKSVENQLKETLKPATEAYFAFLDQSWRELKRELKSSVKACILLSLSSLLLRGLQTVKLIDISAQKLI